MIVARGVPSQIDVHAAGVRRWQDQTHDHDDGLSAFMSVRGRLLSIARQMLGSEPDAEDIVQDVWLRWQATDRSQVRDAVAFLATTTRRLAINDIQSARSRRETSVAPWLPEPIDTASDPRFNVERRQALTSGVRLLLESLTPTERAAFILREAFDYPYREIAKVLRLEEANARQVVTRARRRAWGSRRMSTTSTECRRLLDAFIAAAQTGDVAGLERLVASGAIASSGNGRSLRAA